MSRIRAKMKKDKNTIRRCSVCGVEIKTKVLRQCSTCIRDRKGI